MPKATTFSERGLLTIEGGFIQEKWLNLVRTGRLRHFELPSYHHPLPSSASQQPCNIVAVKTGSLWAWGGGGGWGGEHAWTPQRPFPGELAQFDVSGNSQKSLILRARLYLTWLEACSVPAALPTRNLAKTIHHSHWTSQLPPVALAVGANKSLIKLLKISWLKANAHLWSCGSGGWKSDPSLLAPNQGVAFLLGAVRENLFLAFSCFSRTTLLDLWLLPSSAASLNLRDHFPIVTSPWDTLPYLPLPHIRPLQFRWSLLNNSE